ncbi:hypothetical protein ACJZ2D_010528 [Fusarium nematophilum]
MAHNILITGGSGYLGGDLLAGIAEANLPSYGRLYALVRTDQQASEVQRYGAEPLAIDIRVEDSVRNAILKNNITVVFFLVDSGSAAAQELFIKVLGDLKRATGVDVHFLHTTGAKIFSTHGGAPTDRELRDDDPGLYAVQKAQRAPLERFQAVRCAVNANNTVIEVVEANHVRSYVFAPCIVYGKGRGFGNPISIQTVAIVKAAKALRRVFRTDTNKPIWPVCRVADNTNLYLQILRSILVGQDPGHGKDGYYLASPGSLLWDDIYSAFAKALARWGLVDDDSVEDASDATLEKMGLALGCPKEFVTAQLGGKCTFTASHGKKIGWKPKHSPEDILEAADAEVAWILQNLEA